MSAWFYMLHCSDGSYYTGTTRSEVETPLRSTKQVLLTDIPPPADRFRSRLHKNFSA
jgi:hypothetical protein